MCNTVPKQGKMGHERGACVFMLLCEYIPTSLSPKHRNLYRSGLLPEDATLPLIKVKVKLSLCFN
jgi:hypothetical protein